jgi:hypothetical protein
MKYLLIALTALFIVMEYAPAANAVVCARGVYRAGCAGAGGAAVVRRPVAGAAVVRRPVGGAAVVRGPAGGAAVVRRRY